MGPNETVEIRRALDRLQQSFEILSDRYRELRRERKQLRERIEELHRERDAIQASTAAQQEMAERDRIRAIEFEERVLHAERHNEELFNRIADLERVVAEREALIAEQEDLLARMRQEIEVRRTREEEGWMQSERMREELESLHQQLLQAHSESENYRLQLDQVSTTKEGEIVMSAEALEEMRSENTSLRQLVAQLQHDRSELEAKQQQAIGKLDAATYAEAMARTEVAELQQEKASLENSLAALHDEHGRLEQKLADAEGSRGGSEEGDAEREARERELRELHVAMERKQQSHVAEMAALEERLAAAGLEGERLHRQLSELRLERDTARQGIDSLRLQLRQLEAGDDERLKTQRLRIEQLQAELSQALDIAARKEVEASNAAQELEVLHGRVARMHEELERLRAEEGAGNGVAAGGVPLDEDERREIAEQIDTAIRLIDQHLQSE